jgi:hypothetical protein
MRQKNMVMSLAGLENKNDYADKNQPQFLRSTRLTDKKERYHYDELDVDGRILGRILEK